jgi:hypothetical protein
MSSKDLLALFRAPRSRRKRISSASSSQRSPTFFARSSRAPRRRLPRPPTRRLPSRPSPPRPAAARNGNAAAAPPAARTKAPAAAPAADAATAAPPPPTEADPGDHAAPRPPRAPPNRQLRRRKPPRPTTAPPAPRPAAAPPAAATPAPRVRLRRANRFSSCARSRAAKRRFARRGPCSAPWARPVKATAKSRDAPVSLRAPGKVSRANTSSLDRRLLVNRARRTRPPPNAAAGTPPGRRPAGERRLPCDPRRDRRTTSLRRRAAWYPGRQRPDHARRPHAFVRGAAPGGRGGNRGPRHARTARSQEGARRRDAARETAPAQRRCLRRPRRGSVEAARVDRNPGRPDGARNLRRR